MTLLFRNIGGDAGPAPVVSSVITRGSGPAAFFVDTSPTGYGPDGCPNVTTLATGESCSYTVSFAPPDDTQIRYKGEACFTSGDAEVCVKLVGRLDTT